MGFDAFRGRESGVYTEQVTAEGVAAFARSVGRTSPSADVAPPTYVTKFRRGEFDLWKEMGVPLASILHAEQSYDYLGPIKAGDTVTYRTRLETLLEKRGATPLTFMTFVTDVNIADAKVAISRTTVVLRGLS